MASPQPARGGLSRLGSVTVGTLLGVGYLAIAVLLGVGLTQLHNRPSQAGPPPAQALPIEVPATNTDNNRNTTSTPGPSDSAIVNNLSSSPSAPAAGYTQVSGPDNLATEIPDGWQPARNGDYYQAGDPNDSGRFVRYGATAAPGGDLLASLTNAESTNPNIQNGYRRLQLTSVDYHGDPAVDWEFEFVKSGVTRHVYSRYWETGGTEYFVYVSATADRWPDTAPIFTAMVSSAAP